MAVWFNLPRLNFPGFVVGLDREPGVFWLTGLFVGLIVLASGLVYLRLRRRVSPDPIWPKVYTFLIETPAVCAPSEHPQKIVGRSQARLDVFIRFAP